MIYPNEIWADTDLVCADEPHEGWVRYLHAATAEAKIRALSEALRDAISTYGPKPEILVTEERQETWQAVLDANGSPNDQAEPSGPAERIE